MSQVKNRNQLEKLLRRSRRGCRASRERLDAELLQIGERMAGRIARRERLERDDLAQQGALIALEAAEQWQPEGRLDFLRFLLFKLKEGFSEWCARQRALRGHHLHLPRSVWRDMAQMHREEAGTAKAGRLTPGRKTQLKALKELKGDPSGAPEDPLEAVIRRERARAAHRAVRELSVAQRNNLKQAKKRERALRKLSCHPEIRRVGP